MVQNWIVDWSTACNFRVWEKGDLVKGGTSYYKIKRQVDFSFHFSEWKIGIDIFLCQWPLEAVEAKGGQWVNKLELGYVKKSFFRNFFHLKGPSVNFFFKGQFFIHQNLNFQVNETILL